MRFGPCLTEARISMVINNTAARSRTQFASAATGLVGLLGAINSRVMMGVAEGAPIGKFEVAEWTSLVGSEALVELLHDGRDPVFDQVATELVHDTLRCSLVRTLSDRLWDSWRRMNPTAANAIEC
jgi:hypothetical protein